jgi:hypothetical protein
MFDLEFYRILNKCLKFETNCNERNQNNLKIRSSFNRKELENNCNEIKNKYNELKNYNDDIQVYLFKYIIYFKITYYLKYYV